MSGTELRGRKALGFLVRESSWGVCRRACEWQAVAGGPAGDEKGVLLAAEGKAAACRQASVHESMHCSLTRTTEPAQFLQADQPLPGRHRGGLPDHAGGLRCGGRHLPCALPPLPLPLPPAAARSMSGARPAAAAPAGSTAAASVPLPSLAGLCAEHGHACQVHGSSAPYIGQWTYGQPFGAPLSSPWDLCPGP